LLEANFPSLQEQLQYWSLNVEQHDAFLLMGAALLQHVHTTNQLSELEHNQRLVDKIRKINNYLDAVLPINRQLVMFLAGFGGTGKSRVIQCFKDFARR
jgi:predicted ATPase